MNDLMFGGVVTDSIGLLRLLTEIFVHGICLAAAKSSCMTKDLPKELGSTFPEDGQHGRRAFYASGFEHRKYTLR